MIKFQDNSIITAYIKELLHSFNLPTPNIWTNDTKPYDGGLYIKDNFICVYKNEKYEKILPYTYNKFEPYYTRNLKINTLVYDSATHAYLGNYLRFLRDYHQLDLMSLYNCFTNEFVPDLELNVTGEYSFSTSDPNFKIYMVPVKFFKNYTIALSCNAPYEVICGFYTKGLLTPNFDTEKLSGLNSKLELLLKDFQTKTYKKFASSSFKKPFIYDVLNNDIKIDPLLREYEDNLKLFIKLPISCESSIVILEGNYLGLNDRAYEYEKKQDSQNTKLDHTTNIVKNHAVNNFKLIDKEIDFKNSTLISSLQLFNINSQISYPFADRLIEYLCNNAITHLDNIGDNIVRLQEALLDNFTEKKPGIPYYKYKGIWEDKYRAILYEFANSENLINQYDDILGYVDKEVEHKLKDIDIYSEE